MHYRRYDLIIYNSQAVPHKLDSGFSAGDEIWHVHSVTLTNRNRLCLVPCPCFLTEVTNRRKSYNWRLYLRLRVINAAVERR